MLAAVLKAPGLIELEEVPDAECPKGGALLEVKACAVCGTDIKMMQHGHRDLAYPRILGHEIVGRIIEIDRDSSLAEGNLVQVWPGITCGKCRPCQRGEDNRCHEMKILGFNWDGGFAELLALPGQCVSKELNLLPGGADPCISALAEPLACCINGQEMARVSKGDSVLILGAGPIGCLHALFAELSGAEKIIVVEKIPERILQISKHCRVDAISYDAIDSGESLASMLPEETGGASVDVILTATPEIRVDDNLLKLLVPGGRICIFSGPRLGNYEEPISLRSMHYRELTITGAYGCSSQQNRRATELLTAGKIDVDWIITKRTLLSGIQEALSHSSKRSGLKSVVYAI
jgi:L-iditol 2-dehydrogenase